jgi:hypothetical protein
MIPRHPDTGPGDSKGIKVVARQPAVGSEVGHIPARTFNNNCFAGRLVKEREMLPCAFRQRYDAVLRTTFREYLYHCIGNSYLINARKEFLSIHSSRKDAGEQNRNKDNTGTTFN